MLLAQCILAGLWLAWMSHFFFASRMTKHEAGCQDVANLWALFMKVSQWEVTQFSMNWTIQRMGSLTRLRDMHPGPMEVPSIWVQTILFQSWRLESVDGVGVRFWMIMDVSDPHKSHLGNTDTLTFPTLLISATFIQLASQVVETTSPTIQLISREEISLFVFSESSTCLLQYLALLDNNLQPIQRILMLKS